MVWVFVNGPINQVVKLESRVKAFPEGKTPGVDPCWMNLEELNATHRPVLLWYLALWILQVGRLGENEGFDDAVREVRH